MAGVSQGPTLPVNCGGCGRAAHACPSCGWEWTGLPRSERHSRRGSCISCQVLELAGQRQRTTTTATPEEQREVPLAFEASFDATRARSRLLQRLADAGESASQARYRCYRIFAEMASEASRRADAVARLEARLRDVDVDFDPAA